MAAAAILNFENRLPFLYYWTNPHQIWWECWESARGRNCYIKNAYLLKLKMATAAILSFENRLPFLYYWTNIHQIWWECCESDLKCKCHMKTTYSTKIKMAVAAILNIRKLLPFLFHWTNPHQFQWEGWEFDIKRNCLVKNKSQHGGCRHFRCRKTIIFPYRKENKHELTTMSLRCSHGALSHIIGSD